MKKVILFVLVCLLFFLIWVAEPLSYNPFQSVDITAVDSSIEYECPSNQSQIQREADVILSDYMASGAFIGVSTGFYKEGCGTYLAGSGYSSKRGLTRANGEMLTRIASITKSITAVAIMQLYEKEQIDLDASIQEYLPNYPNSSERPITVRQLLAHTSGIPHYKSNLDSFSFSNYKTLSEALDVIADREVVGEPGETFVYSSFGYTILGSIIEEVSGTSYENYLEENIFNVAGMSNTSIEKDLDYPNKSRLYWKLGPFFARSPHTDLSIIYPGGGVQSTAEDMLKFGEAILHNELIQSDTLEVMLDIEGSQSPISGDGQYALGWDVYHHPENGRIISHSGGQSGANTYLEILLDKGVVVVTLSNAFGTKESVRSMSKDMENVVLELE